MSITLHKIFTTLTIEYIKIQDEVFFLPVSEQMILYIYINK